MRSSEVAAAAGVNLQTLRYYERRGLLTAVPRRSSGYRAFSDEDVRIVRFIKRAQELGLSLDDASQLLALRHSSSEDRHAVRRVAQARLDELDQRIRDLRRMRRALAALVTSCHSGRHPHCPILESLETGPRRIRRKP